MRPFNSFVFFMFVFFIGSTLFFGGCSTKSKTKSDILYSAIKNGDTDQVISLIDDVTEIDYQLKGGVLPLGLASYYGHVEIVKFFIESGANVNYESYQGHPPLTSALVGDISYKKQEIVNLLLKAGADVNFTTEDGMTPLQLGVSRCKAPKTVKLLLDAGANINHTTNKKVSSINRACASGCTAIVELLLDHGADINDNRCGASPLSYAAIFGHADTADLLIERGADLSLTAEQGVQGMTPLHYASVDGHLDVVKALLAAGVDVDVADKQYRTALSTASNFGHLGIVKLLIEAGADVNTADHFGATPLFRASQSGNPDVVEALILSGADMNTTVNLSGSNYSPIDIANEKEHFGVVKILEKHGAKK